LASATLEVAVTQKDILAQERLRITSVNNAAKIECARRFAREALDAVTEHSLSHKELPENLKRSG
jgi:hypothetical protein